jgi:hypothetical protein
MAQSVIATKEKGASTGKIEAPGKVLGRLQGEDGSRALMDRTLANRTRPSCTESNAGGLPSPTNRTHARDQHRARVHTDPAVRRQRFKDVCAYVAQRMLHGAVVYSPIAHSHPIVERFNPAGDVGLLGPLPPHDAAARRCAGGADAGQLASLGRR